MNFIKPNEEQINFYTEAKALVLQRKEELQNVINNQKEYLNISMEQYTLAKLIVEKAEVDPAFKGFVKRQKEIIKKLDEKDFLDGARENIKLGEERLEEIQNIIDKYFTEKVIDEKEENITFAYNEFAIVFGEILGAIS